MILKPHRISRRDELNLTFIFLVAYHFVFATYSSLAYVTFIFYLYSFSFYSPVEGLYCKPKYRANIIHYFIMFIFVFFLSFFFFYHSSCRNDQFTVLNMKFGFWSKRISWGGEMEHFIGINGMWHRLFGSKNQSSGIFTPHVPDTEMVVCVSA